MLRPLKEGGFLIMGLLFLRILLLNHTKRRQVFCINNISITIPFSFPFDSPLLQQHGRFSLGRWSPEHEPTSMQEVGGLKAYLGVYWRYRVL